MLDDLHEFEPYAHGISRLCQATVRSGYESKETARGNGWQYTPSAEVVAMGKRLMFSERHEEFSAVPDRFLQKVKQAENDLSVFSARRRSRECGYTLGGLVESEAPTRESLRCARQLPIQWLAIQIDY